MSLLHAGTGEGLKGSTHAALEALAVVCCGYNAMAFALRREPHLAVNVVLYAALAWWERRLVRHHRRAR
jgi:hypothetical protein